MFKKCDSCSCVYAIPAWKTSTCTDCIVKLLCLVVESSIDFCMAVKHSDPTLVVLYNWVQGISGGSRVVCLVRLNPPLKNTFLKQGGNFDSQIFPVPPLNKTQCHIMYSTLENKQFSVKFQVRSGLFTKFLVFWDINIWVLFKGYRKI